jgi:hypothetical protein
MTRLAAMWRRFCKDERGTLLSDLTRSAIVIGALSVIAAHVMNNRIEAGDKTVLALLSGSAANGRNIDMGATGSLARSVDGTRLDPCALPPKRP